MFRAKALRLELAELHCVSVCTALELYIWEDTPAQKEQLTTNDRIEAHSRTQSSSYDKLAKRGSGESQIVKASDQLQELVMFSINTLRKEMHYNACLENG